MELNSCYELEELVTTWAGLRVLLCCLQQFSITHSGTTASSLSYGQDTALVLSGGRSFIAAIPFQLTYLEEESTVPVCILVGPLEDELRLQLWLSSVPGQTRPRLWQGSSSLSSRPQWQNLQQCDICGCHHRPSGVGVVFTIKGLSWE
jgi:hypothetical protein